MNSWTFFAYVYEQLDGLFLATVQTNADNLLAGLQTPLMLLVTVYIGLEMSKELFDPSGNSLMSFVRKLARAAIVIGMMVAANYTAVFTTFALTTLPNELIAVFGGATNAGALTPMAFDKMLQGGWVAVVQILKNVSVLEPKSLLLALIAGLEFIVGGIFVAVGFLVFIASHIMLGLAITIGPLFVCALLFGATVFLFSAWVCTVLALVITQVLVVGMLALLLGTETQILTQITVLNAATGTNANDIAAQVHYLIEAALLYFMVGYLSPKVAELAQALARGAAPGISAISHAMHDKVADTARTAGSAAASSAKVAGMALNSTGAAGMRSLKVAGKAP